MWLRRDSTARPLVFSIMITKTWPKRGTADRGATSRAAGSGADTRSERLSRSPPPGPDGSGSPPGRVELAEKRTPTRTEAVPGGTVPLRTRRRRRGRPPRSARLTVRSVTAAPAGRPDHRRTVSDTVTYPGSVFHPPSQPDSR